MSTFLKYISNDLVVEAFVENTSWCNRNDFNHRNKNEEILKVLKGQLSGGPYRMRVIVFHEYVGNYPQFIDIFFFQWKENFFLYKFIKSHAVLSLNFLVRKYEK